MTGAPLAYDENDETTNDGNATYVVVPVIGERDQYMTVFSDGSYTRWRPSPEIRQPFGKSTPESWSVSFT